jgi:hypothetical protein
MRIIFGIKKESQPGRKWANGQSLPLLGQEKKQPQANRTGVLRKK